MEVCYVVDMWYSHLQPLTHVLDEVRRLLSVAKLLLLLEPGPCRRSVLQLHRVKEPPRSENITMVTPTPVLRF